MVSVRLFRQAGTTASIAVVHISIVTLLGDEVEETIATNIRCAVGITCCRGSSIVTLLTCHGVGVAVATADSCTIGVAGHGVPCPAVTGFVWCNPDAVTADGCTRRWYAAA